MIDEEAADEVATMPDLALLRHEFEERFQRLDQELARARDRIRKLERRAGLDPNHIGYSPD